MAGQIIQLQPQYAPMIPKKKSFLGDYLPNMAQIFSQALLNQHLWQQRHKTTEEAGIAKETRTRQEQLRDLGYPQYFPEKEPTEAWGPETRKVGEQYFGTQPRMNVRDIPGTESKLLHYMGQSQVLKPEKPEEAAKPGIDKVDLGDRVVVLKDGEPWKVYTKGESPTTKADKITMSKVQDNGFVSSLEIDPANRQKWIDKGYSEGTLKQVTKEGKTPAETVEGLADLYKYHIGQYNQASRGVGQFIEDPNKERVAKESLERALTIAIQHKKAGGNPSALGITPESIREQYKAGNIEESKAVALLQVLFGME